MIQTLKTIMALVANMTASSTQSPQEIRSDYSDFRRDTSHFCDDDWRNSENFLQDNGKRQRLNHDDYISMDQFYGIVTTASGYPINVTEYDFSRFLTPLNNDLLHKIKSGQASAYCPLKNSQDIKHYTVRLGDVLDVVLDHNLPDGGKEFSVDSMHDFRTRNTDRIEQHLDLKSVMLYALVYMHDQRSFLPAKYQAMQENTFEH